MSKTKKLLAIVSGALALVVIVAAYLAYSAYSGKVVALEGDYEEGTEGLETSLTKVEQLSRKAIYPTKENVKALKDETKAFIEWLGDAERLVAKGDRKFEATTPAAFKEFLGRDAKRIDAEFEFGPFKDYITGGSMPAEAELKTLQRQWDDITTIADTMKSSGVAKLLALTVIKEEASKVATNSKNKKRSTRNNAKAAETTKTPSTMRYEFMVSAKPVALVATLNALTTAERFIVIESLAFQRDQDTLASALAGEKKSEVRTSRRGRRQSTDSETEAPAKNQLITDPTTDAPLTVNLKLAVYDFKSLEEEAK